MGSHQFRFGGDYRYSRLDVFYDSNAPGTFTFNGSQGPLAAACPNDTWEVGGGCPAANGIANSSLDSLADFLSVPPRCPATPESPLATSSAFTTCNGGSAFAQDTWKVNSEADFELRFELDLPEPDHKPEAT